MARSEIIHSITYDRNPILAVSDKFTSSITTDNFITIHVDLSSPDNYAERPDAPARWRSHAISHDRRPVPADYEYLDFNAVQEGWNEYKTADGVRIRGRVIPAGMLWDSRDQLYIQFGTPSWPVSAPPGLRGRSDLPDPHQRRRVRQVRNHEPWNTYRTGTGQELGVKLMLYDSIRLAGLYDRIGQPVYDISYILTVIARGVPCPARVSQKGSVV